MVIEIIMVLARNRKIKNYSETIQSLQDYLREKYGVKDLFFVSHIRLGSRVRPNSRK
jgi:hypothetical protein